jgi:type I restriction enzyme S subunit
MRNFSGVGEVEGNAYVTFPTARLDDLCNIKVGRTPPRDSPEFWGEGYPWLSIADMNQGRIVTRTKEQITSHGAKTGTLVEKGTVLLSFKLSIGKVAIAGIPLYTNEAIAALSVKDNNRLIPEFLAIALEAAKLTDNANSAAMGATLNKAKLRELNIPIPPLEVQRRIVGKFGEIEAVRTRRLKVLAALQKLRASTVEHCVRSAMVQIHSLADLVVADDRVNYGVVQPGPSVDDGIPLVRVSDLKYGRIDRACLKQIGPDVERKYARSRLRGTEVLVVCVGATAGRVALTEAVDAGSNVARAIARIPISDAQLRLFVAAYLETSRPQQYFAREFRTVAQPTLNIKQLCETRIAVPDREALVKISRLLEDIEVQMRRTRLSLASIDQLHAVLEHCELSG